METIYYILTFLAGGVVLGAIIYFALRSSSIAKDVHDETLQQLSALTVVHEVLSMQYEEQKATSQRLSTNMEQLQNKNLQLSTENAKLLAQNQHLQQTLETQKREIEKTHAQAHVQFENLANKILEEKTAKFTSTNHTNLKGILDPFQEKIAELKNRVNEAYEKENRERFSLGEKVKELAELNQQISQDAQKLTRALKGESKTQGRWGEMILGSILEKSGLTKGREYFLEYQLRDESNKALYSAFSGKKMRPDAVIKYPDERTVIIDSKVSITAFADLIDETDPDVYQITLNRHVASVKKHVDELSSKAYDDYKTSLDFVMMFVPSEPAYIAAMQGDPNLWNYAYDKRIILLNPTNLITSLKLIADLWKREYQARNVKEISDQGSKLYDKFVDFVATLEKVGKNLTTAQAAYGDAFNKLAAGRGNLVVQSQKLKALGVKTKKVLPQDLIEQSQIENDLDQTSSLE